MNDQAIEIYAARPVVRPTPRPHFLRSEVGTHVPLCQHRARLAAIGPGKDPVAATPSGNETKAGADAGSPAGLTPGLPLACPCGPGLHPVA